MGAKCCEHSRRAVLVCEDRNWMKISKHQKDQLQLSVSPEMTKAFEAFSRAFEAFSKAFHATHQNKSKQRHAQYSSEKDQFTLIVSAFCFESKQGRKQSVKLDLKPAMYA